MLNTPPSQTHSLPTPMTIPDEAPWTWLAAGWKDLAKTPLLSTGYGLTFVIVGYAMSAGLWSIGLSAFIPVAVGAFSLVGPLMAIGLYEMSRRRANGEAITVADTVFVKAASPMQIAYMGFLLMFALFIWARIAMLLYALFVSGTYLPISDFAAFVLGTSQGLSMLVIGSFVGGVIAFVIFAVTAFSIPMLMDRHTDVFTAVMASVQALSRNKKPMFLWAWIIAAAIIVGAATGLLAFVVLFPLIGHATWHAYEQAFPTEHNN